MKHQLRKKYISVEENGKKHYGGNQTWLGGSIGSIGCGIISAADTLWYLKSAQGSALPGACCISKELYMEYIKRIRKSFLMIPFNGMPGFVQAVCMSAAAKRMGLSLKISWGTRPEQLRKRIERMLDDDIPVPFVVGPGLADMFMSPGVRLYRKLKASDADAGAVIKENTGGHVIIAEEGCEYIWAGMVKKHFMVITGLEGDWMRVSSWGECLYISFSEYLEYMIRDGFGAFTNISFIERRR